MDADWSEGAQKSREYCKRGNEQCWSSRDTDASSAAKFLMGGIWAME